MVRFGETTLLSQLCRQPVADCRSILAAIKGDERMTSKFMTAHARAWHFGLAVGVVILGIVGIYLAREQVAQIISESVKGYLVGSR